MSRLQRWGGLWLGLVCAAVVLWPHWLRPWRALVGHPNLDGWSHAWGMHWFVSRLFTGHIPWEVEVASWPERRVLWYVDPLGALLTAPLQLLHPALAYNTLLFAQLTLLGWAGWGFARALGGRGWLAGVALATTPLLQTELWNGVTEAVWLAPVALTGWLAARRSRWTGLAVGLAGLATPYHGLGAALLCAVLTLMGGTAEGRAQSGRPVAGARERVWDLTRAALLAVVLALPQALLLKASVNSVEAFVNRPLWDELNEPSLRTNAVDPLALIRPGDFWSRATVDQPLSSPWKHTPYLGLGLLVLLLPGLWRRPRLSPLLLPLAAAVVGCLGFFLWHEEAWVRTAQGGLYKLPLAYFAEATRLSLVHHLRLVGMGLVVLAGLADVGAGRWAALLAPLIALEHLLWAPNCWPLPGAPAELPAVHEALPADGRAVVDLPADSGNGNRTNRFLYWQALHGRPVPWNNKVGSMGVASDNQALRHWVVLGRMEPVPDTDPNAPRRDADLESAVAELGREGFGWVVLHPELLARGDMRQAHEELLTRLLGPPQELGGQPVWEIPAP